MSRAPMLAVALALPLVLAACGSEDARVPGAVSPGEAKALDDAAQMLDERRLAPEALPTDAAAETPSAELTGDAAGTRR